MAKLHFGFARILLVVAALAPLACSSKDDRSLVVLDIQLDTNVSAPTTVHLRATQAKTGGDTEVKSADVDWKVGKISMQVGLYIPAGVSGTVTITATANAGAISGTSKPISLTVGGSVSSTLTLSLASVTPPVPDGGADLGTIANDASVEALGRDGASDPVPPDLVGADASDAGLGSIEVRGDDGGDVAVSVDAPDAPSSSDAVVISADASNVPADAVTSGDAGHTFAWEPAQNIENDPLNPSYTPVVAVDPVNEHVYVAWDEPATVKVKRWNRTTATWEKTVIVENRGAPDSPPGIGVDAKGNVILIWGQNTGTASVDGLWTSHSSDGVTWSAATRITADRSFDVHLAVARNGTARAVYNKYINGWPLYTAYYDGTGWTELAKTLDANPNSDDSLAQLAVSGTGDGLLIFFQGWALMGVSLTGQTVGALTVMDPDYDTVSLIDPSIAFNRKGQGMVVWGQWASGANTTLLGRTYSAGTGWSNVLPPITSSPTVASTGIALDEQGDATLVWQQHLQAGDNLVGMHGSPTGAWGDITPIETDNVAGRLDLITEYGYPSLAIDGNGNVLAVWRKDLSTSSTTTFGAYGTRYAGGSWLPQAKLGQKAGLDITGLSVAVADSGFGAAAFIYQSQDASTDPDIDNVMVAFFR